MARIFVLLFGLLSYSGYIHCNEEKNTYANSALVQLTPPDDAAALRLRNHTGALGALEVLKMSHGGNDSLDLLIAIERRADLERFAELNGFHFRVKDSDYRRTLDNSMPSLNRRALRSFELYSYNSYDNVQEYLETLATRHPHCVTVERVGNSYERRPIRLVKISNNPSGNHPIIFVDAGVHAREWAAPALALYLIKRLSDNCDLARDDASSLLRGIDWYILPLVNPDGYEFSRNSNRMWRKTRSQYRTGCKGVDGNRNYGFHWGVSGVSNNPCDPQTYAGPKPFSEAETRVVRDIMMRNKARIKLYVSLHAYGQYLVYPWGYTGDVLPKRWQSLHKLATAVSEAVESVGGEPFKVLSAGRWYAAAGGSDDFAFGAANIPYSYTMELTDGYEFSFPEERLAVVLPQFYEGFKVFHKQILRQFG